MTLPVLPAPPPATETCVRFARPDDAPAIVGFGPRPLFEVLIAEQAGAPVGFALFFPHYSTWEGCAAIWVEDLFVEEAARGSGTGRALLAALARLAHERAAPRIDLAVLDWNPARGFYEALGMVQQHEWLPYRMEPDAIAALAAESPPLDGTGANADITI